MILEASKKPSSLKALKTGRPLHLQVKRLAFAVISAGSDVKGVAFLFVAIEWAHGQVIDGAIVKLQDALVGALHLRGRPENKHEVP